MKETILRTPQNVAFSKEIVKYLPQAVRSGLPAEISVVSVSEKKSAMLNRMYRKKDTATNVLSFRYSDEYGEIFVCPAVIRAEAKAQKNSFQYQMTWMIVHGMIHLSGVHHEKSKAAERKFSRIEHGILAKVFNGAATYRYGG